MEDDPIVLYFVVRRSLKLSEGKVGAQCAHGMHYLARAAFAALMTRPTEKRTADFREWNLSPAHRKVVLGATDGEFEQVKRENLDHFLVTDLGFTEVAPNTVTCLALWPMRKSARSPILTQLLPL